jgi:hypothetical protein
MGTQETGSSGDQYCFQFGNFRFEPQQKYGFTVTTFTVMSEEHLPPAPHGHPSVPYHQEMLERGAEEVTAQLEWKAGNRWAYWQRIISDAFKEGTLDEPHFETMDSSMSAGFRILWHDSRFGNMEMQHLFDALKEEVLEAGYTLYMSDERQFLRKDYAETIQRHYCKPALKMENGKVNQLYGNVIIEYRLLDNEPYDLKFSVQFYHDHKYAHPLPWPQLLSKLTGN